MTNKGNVGFLGRGGDWANGSADFESIFPQSEFLMDFRILQSQRIADSDFWAQSLDFGCKKIFSPKFRIQAKFSRQIWLINHNGSVDLHPPIHPPLELITVEP